MLRLAVNGEAAVVLPPKNEGGCKVRTLQEFPGGPVVKTWRFQYSGLGLIPGRGAKILQGERQTKQHKRCEALKALTLNVFC